MKSLADGHATGTDTRTMRAEAIVQVGGSSGRAGQARALPCTTASCRRLPPVDATEFTPIGADSEEEER